MGIQRVDHVTPNRDKTQVGERQRRDHVLKMNIVKPLHLFLSKYIQRFASANRRQRMTSKSRRQAFLKASFIKSLNKWSRPRARRWNMGSSGATNSTISKSVVRSTARLRISSSGTRSQTSM